MTKNILTPPTFPVLIGWKRCSCIHSLLIIFHHPLKPFLENTSSKLKLTNPDLAVLTCISVALTGGVFERPLCCTRHFGLKALNIKIISCVNDHSTTHSCSILSPWRRAYGLLWSSTISECRAMISSSRWLTSATYRTNQESITKRIAERHSRPNSFTFRKQALPEQKPQLVPRSPARPSAFFQRL